MPIVVLSAQVINKIAAGEVIDCPASVVKELVENSIDAGASTISVHIDKGGRNLISVTDDGCGISSEDMERAFVRHATSKLVDGNLFNVRSMGFRGEGLTSIAAVARVKMVSKHFEADKAWSVTFEGGEKTKDLAPESLPCGTCVEVRDLFFYTPTRLKFLRTEKVEIQNIVDLLNKLAMVNYSIAFSLNIEERQVFKYLSQDKLEGRLREIKSLGDAFLERSMEVSGNVDYLKVNGFVGFPTFNRSKPGAIYTFVNNRPIHSSLLISAVKVAYSGLIPKDRHPIAVLTLEISPGDVDVNVHPSKLEVRFRDNRFVYSTVLSVLQEALSRNMYTKLVGEDSKAVHGCDHFAIDNMQKICGNGHSASISEFKGFEANLTDSSVHPKPVAHVSSSYESGRTKHEVDSRGSIGKVQGKIEKKCSESHSYELIEEQPLGNAVCQLFGRYIISQARDYAVIVDQHAAHERLVLEYMKKVKEKEGIKRQVLIMPEFIELDSEYEFELLNEHRDKLLKLGLVIEPIGDLTVVVREVPAIFGAFDIKGLVSKIVGSIMKVGEELFMEEQIKHICGTIACYGSIRSGRIMRLEEMNALLRNMETTPHSGQCNHGRPTYVKLRLSELDNLFERT